jgi:hypothetical protein
VGNEWLINLGIYCNGKQTQGQTKAQVPGFILGFSGRSDGTASLTGCQSHVQQPCRECLLCMLQQETQLSLGGSILQSTPDRAV